MSKFFYYFAPEIFALTISIIAGCLIYTARIGFDNDLRLIITSILISLHVVFFPKFINIFFRQYNNGQWYFSDSFLILISFATITIGGQLNRILKIELSDLFAIAGLLQFILVLIFPPKKDLPKKNLLFLLTIAFIFILFGIWVTSAYYFNFYLDPLMKEKIINGAWPHRDSMFHASIAGMIKTYGVVSTGLDGVNVPVYYHTFSHFVFASLSALLDISTMTFYALIFPIIIIPFFFLSFIYCTISFHKIFISKINSEYLIFNNLNYWIVLFALFAIPLPIYWLVENYHYLYSQSYSLAIILSFILFSIVAKNLDFFIKKKFLVLNVSNLLFLIILLILFASISLSKFSFLYFLSIVFIFFYIRKKLFYNLGPNLILIGIILISLSIYAMVIYPFQLSWPLHGFGKERYFSKLFISITTDNYYTYLYPSILYIIIKFNYLKIFTFKKFFNNLIAFELLDIELLIVLSIGLILFPYGNSNTYTYGIQIYVVYVLLLASIAIIPGLNSKLPELVKVIKINKDSVFQFFKKILLICILIFMFMSLLDNIFLKSIGKFIASNLTIRETFYLENDIQLKGTHDEARERYLTTHRKYRTLIRSLNQQKISEEINKLKKLNPNNTAYREEFEIISLLYKLSDESIKYKKESVIYIPKNLNSFWNISCDKRMTPFIVPAVSNIAMIEGIPIAKDSCYGDVYGVGYKEYKNRNLIGNSKILSENELCKKAKRLSFKRVIEINKDQNNIIKSMIHECYF